MARKRLSAEEEAQAIADAVAMRDDPSVMPMRVPGRPTSSGSAVLSVRLPVGQVRMLRAMAAERRISLSEMLSEAVTSVLAGSGPTLSASKGASHLFMFGGVGPEPTDTSGDHGASTLYDESPTTSAN
jgi:hypothetical protein